MRVDTALLCEAATVRDGLLYMLGGAVTTAVNAEYPAELGLTLALRIMLHPTEAATLHQLEIVLQDADGERIARVLGELQVTDPALITPGDEGETLIAWSFPGKPELPHPGRYSFELLIDGIHQRSIPLTAVEWGQEEAS